MKITPFGIAIAFLVLIVSAGVVGTGIAFLNGFPGQYTKTTSIRGGTAFVPGETTMELGTFRGKTADKAKKVFALKVVLGYAEKDPSFAEELDAKNPELKAACLKLFETCFISQFDPGREEGIKTGVLRTVNSLLVLGKVTTVYFRDIQVF